MTTWRWLKLWNEAPDDPKWIAVADLAGCAPQTAFYTFTKAMAYANEHDRERGSITGLQPQVIASFCRVTVAEVSRIFQAFRELGMLIGDRIANWAKRQKEKIAKPRSAAAERQARHREKVAAASAQGEFALAVTPVTPVTPALLSSVTPAAEEEEEEDSEADASESIAQPTAKPSPTPEEFDEFWDRYPRKVGKGAARTAYARARKIANWPELMSGVLRYAAECTDRDPRFIKHPATWLKAECWNDEPEPQHLPENGVPHGRRPLPYTDFSKIFAGIMRCEEREAAA